MNLYWRTLGWMLLPVVLALTLGCAQTQSFMKADNARVSQEEKTDFSISPQGAGGQTDWMMYQEDEGAGP